MIINVAVLATVLEADLGSHRKIGRFRVARPLLTAAAIVPLFLKSPATEGTGRTLEILGIAAGLLTGLLAAWQLEVYRSPRTGRPVTRAGLGYAAVWTAVIGARSAFSYGSVHWFGHPLGQWMFDHEVTADALTDSLLLMAVAMSLTRTAALLAGATRAR